jgi:hypothetical protein
MSVFLRNFVNLSDFDFNSKVSFIGVICKEFAVSQKVKMYFLEADLRPRVLAVIVRDLLSRGVLLSMEIM